MVSSSTLQGNATHICISILGSYWFEYSPSHRLGNLWAIVGSLLIQHFDNNDQWNLYENKTLFNQENNFIKCRQPNGIRIYFTLLVCTSFNVLCVTSARAIYCNNFVNDKRTEWWLTTVACYRYATPFFIQRGHRRSLPILRKKLLNGQTPEMKSQPLEQSSCLETQSQLEQSIARKREIRCEKFQNLTNVFR